MLHCRILIFALCLLAGSPAALRADSFYSSMGLGLPSYFVSPKAVGMGGAGIGVIDALALNAMNPAAIDVRGVTTIAVDSKYESTDNKNALAKVNTRQGQASGFRFVIPLKRSLNVIAALKPLTQSRYLFKASSRIEDLDYSRTIRGNGGLSAGSFGVQAQLNRWLALAAVGNLNFGNFEEQWKTDFENTQYRDTADEIVSHLWGVNFEFGAVLTPYERVTLGLTFKSSSDLNAEVQTTLGSSLRLEPQQPSATLPMAFGIGISAPVAKFTLALDYYQRSWSDSRFEHSYSDYRRFSGGIEFIDSTDPYSAYSRRIPLRLGAYVAQLPFTNAGGGAVSEQFVSFGFGLPFYSNRGRLDFALEVGKRGNIQDFSYEETIYRFSASITTGELWFQR